ncbi:hypothetical protein [Petrimonas mucosa]|uniref:hypothetical protein n=1 Tax=Petrimonas mucosa TaxID=1642646 RepID=UPI00175F138B|nr:hypothetical protein [Petrimonas mucosa]HHT29865.1 hypothetical protein [Petrimonas mucosa]
MAKNYANIMGSNDRIRVGVLGFSDRFKSSLGKAFLKYADEMNFELYTICDIWSRQCKQLVKDLFQLIFIT